MHRALCTNCHRLQHLHAERVEFIDHGAERSVTWWRCEGCNTLGHSITLTASTARDVPLATIA